MKVTLVPGQILFCDAVILIAGLTKGLMLMLMLLLVALAGAAQAALPVITQLTISPSAKLLPLKVVLFVPALLPFTSH